MPDADVRSLERAWRSSGAEADYRAYLRGRQREGTLSQEALQVAAYVGDEVARGMLRGDAARLVRPPASGVQRFMGELPGGGRVQARAAIAACRFATELPGQTENALARRAVGAAEAWLEERDHTCPALLEELNASLAEQLGYFRPELPPIAVAYEADDAYGLDAACWIVLCHATGRAKDGWGEVGRCMAALVPQTAGQKKLRAAIKAALVPWVFVQTDPLAGSGACEAYALFRTDALTPEVAEAILAVAPSKGKLKLAEARAAIEVFLRGVGGWRQVRGSFLNEDRTLKLMLKTKVVHVLEGGPGKWSKLEGTKNRQIFLSPLGSYLRDTAQAQISRGAG